MKVREASFDDYAPITALGQKYGLKARTPDEWLHLWVNNPEYRSRPGWPIGWVLENNKGELVGAICNIPLRYEFKGQTLITATGRCWVTEAEYRGYAILLLDEYFNQPNVDLFLNTTVNQHAMEAYKSFDSPRVPKGSWDRSAFWITNYAGFAKSALAARKSTPLLTYPLAASLLMKDCLTHCGIRPEVRVSVEQGFDERFDVFWSELREKKFDILIGVRTREVLDWHFRYPLQSRQLYILTASNRDRLIAYAIFYRKDKEEYGLKRVRLVDYQSLDDNPATLASMLACILSTCRKERIHMLEDVGCCLQGVAAPHRRELPSWLFYYKAKEQQLAAAAAWQPSLFDGDSSL
ncbi:MAG: hypothetical protein ACR2NN_16430 [Bryobacteraceae bacterium]